MSNLALIALITRLVLACITTEWSYLTTTLTNRTVAPQATATVSAAPAARRPPRVLADRLGKRPGPPTRPELSIEPYVRPELAARLQRLRPTILAAAARHNPRDLSGMSDRQFAAVMVLLLYNEHNGWLEDRVEPLRIFTPLYENLQVRANTSGIGSNFSVWPANLRPSVALEILRQQVPVPGPRQSITVPITVTGSRIVLVDYASSSSLLAAISAEISRDDLAIEYLAANLERGVYRANFEATPVTWRTLAAWHNQGIVDPKEIRANPTASSYVRRASAYLLLAEAFVAGVASPAGQRERLME